jgi:prepilin-type processing-associated H-X9-DG protein
MVHGRHQDSTRTNLLFFDTHVETVYRETDIPLEGDPLSGDSIENSIFSDVDRKSITWRMDW